MKLKTSVKAGEVSLNHTGDTAATAFTSVPSISTTEVRGSAVGAYPITSAIGSLSSTNYTFGFVNGTVTITP